MSWILLNVISGGCRYYFKHQIEGDYILKTNIKFSKNTLKNRISNLILFEWSVKIISISYKHIVVNQYSNCFGVNDSKYLDKSFRSALCPTPEMNKWSA